MCMLAYAGLAQRTGYHSPLSRDSPEKMYATDVFSESPPRKSAPPATKKRFKDQLEADIDALSFHSSDPEVWDPTSKTPEEIAAWCAEYVRGNRRLMAKRHRMGIAGIIRVPLY